MTIVPPFFEEPSVRETLDIPAQLRVWQEDESPLALFAAWLHERDLSNGRLCMAGQGESKSLSFSLAVIGQGERTDNGRSTSTRADIATAQPR
jgi:hypothetical protein